MSSSESKHFNHSLGGTFDWVMRREHPIWFSFSHIWILGFCHLRRTFLFLPSADSMVSLILPASCTQQQYNITTERGLKAKKGHCYSGKMDPVVNSGLDENTRTPLLCPHQNNTTKHKSENPACSLPLLFTILSSAKTTRMINGMSKGNRYRIQLVC